MDRPKRKNAKVKLSHDLWNQMWGLFCPWVSELPLKPAPIVLHARAKRTRHFLAALLVFGTLSSAAYADNYSEDGKIVLAALNNTVPSDRDSNHPGLFGSSEQRYSDIRPFTKWTNVLNRFKSDFVASLDQPQVKDWMSMLASVKDASKEDKIEAVNDYMNKVHFVPDSKNYGNSDYWATPMEFLTRGGDCEDYAIAKYISLRSLGFRQDEMRLAIVYDRVMRMPHALLIVYNDGEAKVLDNQNPGVMNSAELTRYKPIYSISQVAWWRH